MLRIILMSPPNYMPSYMADLDGFYSFDLNENEKVALTKKIDDYASVGTIKQDTFKEIQLPITKKNRLLLDNIGNPNSLNKNNSKIFNVQIIKDNDNYPCDGLQVLGISESGGEKYYDCKIFGELNKWYRPLKNLYLNELSLGSDVVDASYINDLTDLNYSWQEGNTPVYTNLVNYGDWFVNANLSGIDAQSQIVFNNFRLWHSLPALLKQAFCQIGYKLICPILDTDYFSRVWMYLLDAEFETANQLDVANRGMIIGIPSVYPVSFLYLQQIANQDSSYEGVFLLSSVAFDPGSHYIRREPNATTIPPFLYDKAPYGTGYNGGLIGFFRFGVQLDINIPSGVLIPIGSDYITIKVSIRKSNKFGVNKQKEFIDRSSIIATKTLILKTTLVAGVHVYPLLDVSIDNYKVYQHEMVFAHIEVIADLVDGGGAYFDGTYIRQYIDILSAELRVVPRLQVIEDGDTLDFGALLRKDLTCLDLFKGFAHLINGKVETDNIKKIVYCYPEFGFNLYDDGYQESYFKQNINNPFEATELIQRNSLDETFINTDLGRNIKLKFLDSSDGYILNLNLPQELHSKEVDFGSDYQNTDNLIENPFFEPTKNDNDQRIDLTYNNGITDVKSFNQIPFIWEDQPNEGEYPQRTIQATPRILIAYPPVWKTEFLDELTGVGDLTGIGVSQYVYEDTVRLNIVLFGQIFKSGVKLFPNPLSPSDFYTPNLAIVYGNGENPLIEDFYTLFYYKSIKQAYYTIALNFLVKLDVITFSNISFRRKWHLKYLSAAWGEIDIYCRLSSIQDYVIGGNITTPVQLIPDNNNFTICV